MRQLLLDVGFNIKMKRLIVFCLIIIALSGFVVAEEQCGADEVCGSANTGAIVSPEIYTHGEEKICVVYFYGDGCSNCAKIKPFLDDLESRYKDDVLITRLEIYHDLKNYQSYNEYCNVQSIDIEQRGVPFVAIGEEYYMGVSQIKQSLEPKIQEMIESGERVCPLGGEMACHPIQQSESGSDDFNQIIENFKPSFATISLPLVVVTGLVDGINPCAFAVLIFLLTFLMQISSNRKRMIKAGIAYIIAVYFTYFIAGIGLLSVIQVSGFSGYVVRGAAVIAIIAGLINIKDYFWYGKGISLGIPDSKKGIIQKWTKRANIPSALVLGFLVSMFELPCTGGVYLAILAMLASSVTKLKAVEYLLVYNFMFVLPLIVIMFLVIRGMSAEKIESWRNAKKTWMRLALGLLLVALGIIMIIGWF